MILHKSKEYFFSRLNKNINNSYVCDLLDNSYINNYKKLFIQRLSIIPKLIKGLSILKKLLNKLSKKNAIKKINAKMKLNNFGKKLGNILTKKLKDKFINRVNNTNSDVENPMNKNALNISKFGKRIKRIIDSNLKRHAFNKIKDNYKMHKKLDKLKNGIKNIFSKMFMNKLKNKFDKINALNKIQKMIDKKKSSDSINQLKNIANSSEGIENQKRLNCIKLKNNLEKLINDKVKKDIFKKLKTIYFDINKGVNKLNKLMNDRYKKRLLYLINLIYVYNKPKTGKIKSRYPAFNMTDLSNKIEKLLLKKIKKKFINELKNIKKIDKQLYYMFTSISNNVKKKVFDTLKILDFINHLSKIIKDKNKLKEREFIDKLKDIQKSNIENNNNILRDYLNKWRIFTNTKKILDKMKNYLKLNKCFNLWKKIKDLNNIKNILLNKKKLQDKEKKDTLNKYFNRWKDYLEKKKILSKLKDYQKGKKEVLDKYFNKWKDYKDRLNIISKLKDYQKEKNDKKDNLNKYFNKWKDYIDRIKIISKLKDNQKEKNDKKDKLNKYFNKWKDYIDRLNIFSKLKDYQKEKIKEINKNTLKKYLNKLNDKAIRRKALNEIRKLSKLKNCFKIYNKINNNIIKKYFNNWKNKIKSYKTKSPKIIKLEPQKVENTEIKAIKPKKHEYTIIKQNILSIIDSNNNNKNNIKNKKEKNEKKEKSLKKRKVKRNKTKSKSKKKVNKNKNNLENLKKGFEKWKNNIKQKKILLDRKNIINGIKKYNQKNGKKDDISNSDEELLKKLKKASIYLLLDIYKKNRDLLLKKYFNKWIKKINEINKKENKTEKESKYKFIKKKKGIYDKIKEINEIKNKYNKKNLNLNNQKKFIKRKTKLNLYQDRMDLYNSLSDEKINNVNPEEDYYKPYIEKNNIINSAINMNKYNSNFFEPNNIIEESTESIVDETPEQIYISKSMEKRTPKRKNPYNLTQYYKTVDNPIEPIEDNYPYDNRLEDNYNNLDLDKTLSSVNYSTNNHFTLVEESNEVRNPTNYKNNTVFRDYNKKSKIRSLLSPAFEQLDPNDESFQYNNILTDRNTRNNDNLNDYISRSQKNRNKNKRKMFTVSIPIKNEDNSDIEYINTDINDNNQKKNKGTNNIINLNKYNNKTNNNNRNYSKYLNTPSNDYYINWEEGNSTSPKIIRNESNQDKKNYGLNDYNTLTNKGRNKKINKYNKYEYIPEKTFNNTKYINNGYDYRKIY